MSAEMKINLEFFNESTIRHLELKEDSPIRKFLEDYIQMVFENFDKKSHEKLDIETFSIYECSHIFIELALITSMFYFDKNILESKFQEILKSNTDKHHILKSILELLISDEAKITL
jgi:hypothetical protein